MGHIEPTEEQLAALGALPQNEPVIMLNLLSYRTKCADDSIAAGMSGQDAYARYGQEVAALTPPFAGEMEYLSTGEATVIGPKDEHWDLMLLVRYPSIQSFIDAISRPDYQAAGRWRTAALRDSRLIALSPPAQTPAT